MYCRGVDKEVKRIDKVESCVLLYQTRRAFNYYEDSTKASQRSKENRGFPEQKPYYICQGYTTETFLLGLQSSRIEFHSFEGIKVNTFSITRTDQSEYFCEQAEELLTYYIVQRMSFVEMTYLQIGDYKIHKKKLVIV